MLQTRSELNIFSPFYVGFTERRAHAEYNLAVSIDCNEAPYQNFHKYIRSAFS